MITRKQLIEENKMLRKVMLVLSHNHAVLDYNLNKNVNYFGFLSENKLSSELGSCLRSELKIVQELDAFQQKNGILNNLSDWKPKKN